MLRLDRVIWASDIGLDVVEHASVLGSGRIGWPLSLGSFRKNCLIRQSAVGSWLWSSVPVYESIGVDKGFVKGNIGRTLRSKQRPQSQDRVGALCVPWLDLCRARVL